jgi:BirA family biotin operon repressor/biotin-[acetyl-CoA-carboxylase] ligase
MLRKANQFRVAELRGLVKPFRLHFFTSLRSTNDHAGLMRRRGDLYAPAIVLAARQTAGRGRGTNTWFSAAGSLTVTFVLPVNEMLVPHHVPLAAGLAVRDAAAEAAGVEGIGLKWPNDLYYGERKLAGLLCERVDNVDLIGVGVNVNVPLRSAVPRGLKDRIVFLEEVVGGAHPTVDLTTVLATVARHMYLGLVRRSETPFPVLLREYDRHHVLVGRGVSVVSGDGPALMGTCEGLDDVGRLLVREGGRVHRVIAGHVELR